MTTVYLDVCCLNRPFDDQAQDRIRIEAEAVLLVLAHVQAGEWDWLGSDVVDEEVGRTSDRERRTRVQSMLSGITHSITLGTAELGRALDIRAMGFRDADSLHLACAESGGVDVLLTVDDQLVRTAARHAQQLHVRVENPVTWLREQSDQ